MFATGRQSWYNSQGSSFGNATITGTKTSTSGNVYANNLSTSQYLTFSNYGTTSGSPSAYISYSYCGGTFTVSGNTAQLDILVVGAGGSAPGAVNGNISGGDGGQVGYYSNVIVPVGTYVVSLGAPVDAGGNGIAQVFLTSSTTITANPGNAGSSGGAAQGGTGAGGSPSGPYGCNGGIGKAISDMADDLTWIYSANGNPYFGAGGGGVFNYSASTPTNWTAPGGFYGAGDGSMASGQSPNAPISTQGRPMTGGGKGAGNPGNTSGETGLSGSGVIVIRHRNS